MQGFKTQAVGSEVHRNKNLGLQILESPKRLLGIHVVFAKFGAVVRPDGEKGDFRVQFSPDFTEPVEVA